MDQEKNEVVEKTPSEQGRVKIVCLNAKLLIAILNWTRNPNCILSLPVTDELPADSVVVSVNASWSRRCIEALVASAEFPICPEGAEAERIQESVDEFMAVDLRQAVGLELLGPRSNIQKNSSDSTSDWSGDGADPMRDITEANSRAMNDVGLRS